ncbi:glycoside hydrolase family 97 protein [Halosquirtibacter xylanolyticus]|uniref:glycoside hydrolase family 97 protein n=1 Tax=Halosquirtibacter xylanolyticus TaxID=3374599 RepID=UPI003747A21B|nr:glycoside hydrolase family 97 protein [Prolixibacteraceae bacterium]
MSQIKQYRSILILVLFVLYSCTSRDHTSSIITSPNGGISLTFSSNEKGLFYSIKKDTTTVFKASRLGFKLKDKPDLNSGFEIISVNKKEYDKEWRQVWGQNQLVRDQHHELMVHLQEKQEPKRKIDIVFRLFNDGIGFRYIFPEQDNLNEFIIMDELTEFNLNDDYDTWSIKAYQKDRYEYLYRKQKLTCIDDTVHTPLTMVNPKGLAVSIHEANLTDYASMTLYRTNKTTLHCDLVPWADGTKVYAKAGFKTPWRTIQIGAKPTDLLQSNLILNLNDPCQFKDVSWIKPAKYVGVWWEMHLGISSWGQGKHHGANTENVKRYIDFAAENNLQGVLVEGWNVGWDEQWWLDGSVFKFTTPYPDFDIKAVTDYANARGVNIIGHHETGGAITNYENQLEDALDYYQKYGIKYIKSGYVNPNGLNNKEWHHGQFGVRHYRKVVEEAAKRHIMVCMHEPIKSTGLRRTFPNLMSSEGARGQEFNAWGPNGGNPPSHEPTLIFTRLLAGPMDYTPGIFDISLPQKKSNQVNTTIAKQLALYVTLYSPLQMAADLPEHYINQPAFEFIKSVPVDWERTIALNGQIGEYVTIVRKDKASDSWYLGSITNEEPRQFDIDLSFLDPNATYKATVYADGKDADYQSNPTDIMIYEKEYRQNDSLQISLKRGGGTSVVFKKIHE